MRPIDADAGAKDAATLKYGGVKEAILIKQFLDAQPTIAPPPTDPLTLEELREMDGEPVWLVTNTDRAQWAFVIIDHEEFISFNCADGTEWEFDLYGDNDGVEWLAYRCKLEEGTHEH